MMDITAIITAHREGAMAGISLRSLKAAATRARGAGLSVEILAVLDRPDAVTRLIFADADKEGWHAHEVDFGDQGQARNHAVNIANGNFIAFLDGDDLWSENWLEAAHAVCRADPAHAIAHPEVDWFFESNNNLFFHIDQDDPAFDPSLLRLTNYWDALCMAPRRAYLDYPFDRRDVPGGIAYEDWQWNCQTLDAGFVHRVVPGTIHFKRRRQGSQTIQASAQKCLTPMNPLLSYRWRYQAYRDAARQHDNS